MAKIAKLITKNNPNLLKIKERILSSEFIKHKLKDIDISHTDLEKNFAYLQICIDDFKKQSKCSKKKCNSQLDGYWNDFYFEDNQLIKTLKACHCLQMKKGNWVSIENISLDTFNKNFHNFTIKDFKPKNKTEDKIKEYLIKVIDIFPKYSKPLIILGVDNKTKETIMSATANELYEKNPNIAYVNLENNLIELEPEYSEKFNVIKERYKNTQALFINHVGSEKNNGFVRDFFLYEVLKYRCKNKLFTMMGSDFSLGWLEKTYSKNNNKIKAEMLMKIIKENFIPI